MRVGFYLCIGLLYNHLSNTGNLVNSSRGRHFHFDNAADGYAGLRWYAFIRENQRRKQRKIMDKLIQMLKRHEGVETHVYLCSADRQTIGVGRNVDARGGLGIYPDEVEFLLSNDILRCIKELSKEYVWFGDLDETRQEAVIDAFFCLGATKFRGFQKMILAFEEADYKEASIQLLLSKFAKQTGKRAIELAEMIETGAYP